jgi:hypothetical protein
MNKCTNESAYYESINIYLIEQRMNFFLFLQENENVNMMFVGFGSKLTFEVLENCGMIWRNYDAI